MSQSNDILNAVKGELGRAEDNLYRCAAAARDYPLDKEWGESGRTMGSVLKEFQLEAKKWRRAMAFAQRKLSHD